MDYFERQRQKQKKQLGAVSNTVTKVDDGFKLVAAVECEKISWIMINCEATTDRICWKAQT